MTNTRVLVWVHGDCLRPNNPALLAHPDAPALFVFDDELLKQSAISLKRILFIYECLLELPVMIRRGNVVTELLNATSEHRSVEIVTTESPSPRFDEMRHALEARLSVKTLPEVPFLNFDGKLDLKRFSRYWRVAQEYAFG